MLKITLVVMGNKMPNWVHEASQEFIKRLHEGFNVQLIELPLFKRGKSAELSRILNKEMLLMRAAIPNNTYLIALDKSGTAFNSERLAEQLQHIQQASSHICFIIGGPEGLATALLTQCHASWSLSSLTLPHGLARVVLLEALYRAWSILHHHPYHK